MSELALALATVVVYTAEGEPVWSMEGVASSDIVTLGCPTSFKGSILAAGIRRAVEDIGAIAAGRDPDRPSEEAIRPLQDVEEEMEADRLITAILSRATAEYREPFTWAVKAQGSGEIVIATYHDKAVRTYRAETAPAAPGGIRIVEKCETV